MSAEWWSRCAHVASSALSARSAVKSSLQSKYQPTARGAALCLLSHIWLPRLRLRSHKRHPHELVTLLQHLLKRSHVPFCASAQPQPKPSCLSCCCGAGIHRRSAVSGALCTAVWQGLVLQEPGPAHGPCGQVCRCTAGLLCRSPQQRAADWRPASACSCEAHTVSAAIRLAWCSGSCESSAAVIMLNNP